MKGGDIVNRALRRCKALRGYGDELIFKAATYAAMGGYNAGETIRLILRDCRTETGSVNVQGIIMIFIAIVIIYQLIPNISSSNVDVQNSANASTMAKFAAGLGEWMFPLLGIIAVVFLLFRGRKKGGV